MMNSSDDDDNDDGNDGNDDKDESNNHKHADEDNYSYYSAAKSQQIGVVVVRYHGNDTMATRRW